MAGRTVVCGILLVLLAKTAQRRFIDAIEGVAPGRGFLCITAIASRPPCPLAIMR
jgi:phosphatidylethanolamine/phosphatidyl-N-methylethanolamine N-methyltransferase